MWCLAGVMRGRAVIIGRVVNGPARRTDTALAARLAALASFGAAVIHFAVVPAHWQEWVVAGQFFALLALFQLVWARAVLARPTNLVLAGGVLLNLGAIALWVVSRTVGAPFGPHAGEPELVQAADLCALLLQLYVVMGAGWLCHRGLRGKPISWLANGAFLLGATSIVALASTVGVASGLQHGHHSPSGTGTGHHGPGVDHADEHRAHPPEANSPAPLGESVGTPAQTEPAPRVARSAVPLHDSHDHEHG